MTHAEVSGLDLGGMSKAQLKLYVKKAREVWGEWIDLRKADVIALQQYLQDYQAWAARIASIALKMVEEETTATPEATATDIETATEAYRGCGIYIAATEGGYSARIRDLDCEIDLTVEAPTKEEIRSAAIAAIDSAFNKMIEAEVAALENLPDFENGEPHVTCLADFEGITDAPLGDWWMSCSLSCDPCNFQVCDLPPLQMQLPFVAEVMRQGAKAMLESLEKRSEGAMDEALMQDYIDRAGLFEELEKAWREIPDYEEFSEIFQMDAQMGMIMEILMPQDTHDRYVEVCKAAIAIEQDFARKALLLLAR
ncbi:hypothetical protein SAMD00079811_83230 (plasmid) [Scytonema sp. HK-05]|uniref:hypothetical protein n=1 Tax=Scytonema sp. HK-05 TaxID=1137095 RepID=UPI000AB70ED1|nr:hypothetical protein [Scytonema sp. HK-05]BAY50692.1 hypothetical protein SAMD00079811_83230 [Scytonema sp. HK-05]